MNPVELLRQCQGNLSQTEYAELLNISQPYLSMILNEQRPPTAELMLRLAKCYPEIREQVLGFYFAPEYHNQDVAITGSATCPEAQ